MTDLYEWLALRRVSRGGVAKRGDRWLDGGRPMPCFLPEKLDELIQARLVTMTDSDHDNTGQCRSALTDAGAARYAALTERNESR
ncbi:MAG: hypothetical protein ACRDQG_02185 [Pseudonocardiaceae bacterium]